MHSFNVWMGWLACCFLSLILPTAAIYPYNRAGKPQLSRRVQNGTLDAHLDQLVANMTVPELVLQLHLMFADNIIGPTSDNSLYDAALSPAPSTAGVGVIHDWYPLNTSRYNELQALNIAKSRLKIPFMHFGECLHGVGSFKQSMFPQSIGMSASFDTELVQRVGRAIGTEARSIGVHACLSPVLDLGKDVRWGRAQEAWGEDFILTSHMGVAYASGLSKNGSWSDPDAVVPVMKHFAAHGSPEAGHNAAPFMGHGNRQVLEEMLVPFKAAVDLGGVKGVMMSYNEVDDVPNSVNPMLYQALDDWGFDGFVTADDTGMSELENGHEVADSPADAIAQWHNAGGMIQYYDYPLDTYLNATIGNIANGTVSVSTLRFHVRRILSVKADLGLFDNPYIPSSIDPYAITASNAPLTLEAAHKSIVLLENRNATLPIRPADQGISKIALIGPFGDVLNYGDYSGQWGAYPTANSSTIRQGLLSSLASHAPDVELVTSMGANTWLYNAQYAIPAYLLSANGTSGGLMATYYADTNFSTPLVKKLETPSLDWGLYPPPGLPSNNFSVVWEGELEVPVEGDVDGWIGVAVYPNTTATLYVDGTKVVESELSATGTIMGNIESYAFSQVNSTTPPTGSTPFTFSKGATHKIRIEYQAYNLYQKIANENSLNAEILLFWNLVDQTDPVGKAVEVAQSSDIILLAVGAGWNSDGEGGDRATLELAPNQTALADAMFSLNKPVILVLQGGRPFAIPEYYAKAAAVLNTFFPGQSGGQAIANVLLGDFNPGGRIPLSVPYYVGQLPTYYNYKATARQVLYTDIDSWPAYPFGYGLSYTTFTNSSFSASSSSGSTTFSATDIITFSINITNNGTLAGNFVPQVYLLRRRKSSITRPTKQLVAFSRVYLDAGEETTVQMDLEVDRYLKILNRAYEWEVEKGDYTFAFLGSGGHDEGTGVNVTMTCV